MKLKDAYIIDGDVIEKRIEQLEKLNNSPFSNGKFSEAIQEMIFIKQHLKPALTIVENAYQMGCYTGLATHAPDTVLYNNHKNEFLTKDF